MTKVTQTFQNQVIDQNGEIVETEIDKTINWGKEPNYVKLYLDDILYLSDLPKGYNSILYAFIKEMGYGNKLVLNAALKRMIAKDVGLGVSSVNNALSKFVKGQLLKRIDTGIYLVNPQLFGKGEWKDISKIRLTAKYDLKGRTIMAEIERNSDKGKEAQKKAFDEKYRDNQQDDSEEMENLDVAQKFFEDFEQSKEQQEEMAYYE